MKHQHIWRVWSYKDFRQKGEGVLSAFWSSICGGISECKCGVFINGY